MIRASLPRLNFTLADAGSSTKGGFVRPRGSLLILGMVAAALVFLCYLAAFLAPAVGLYHDDAIYTVTAKSLAEGQGYRILSLPNEIPQTKYPILFPLLLSLVWRVFPTFPDNVLWLKLVPFGAALVWFWLVYRLLKRETGEPALAGGIVLLTMVAPRVLHFTTILLSETLFAALAWGSLWFLRSCERGDGRTAHVVAAALITAATFHTRTIGAVLIVAGIIGLLIVRRVRWALLFGSLSVLLVLPWFLWVVAQGVASLPEVYSYYTAANYRDWNVLISFPWVEKLWIVVFNSLALLQAPTWLLGIDQRAVLVPCFLVGLLAIAGLLRDAFRGMNVLHVFTLGYAGTVLLWAWPSPRFYMPVLPLLLLFASREGVRLSSRIPHPDLRKGVVIVAISALALPTGFRFGKTSMLAIERGIVCPIEPCRDEWAQYLTSLNWIENQTPEEAVVLSNHDPMVYLYAGRKSIGMFNADPFELFYALDEEHEIHSSTETLVTGIRESGVDYLFLTDRQDSLWDQPLWRQFRILRPRCPGVARALVIGPTPGMAIYQVAGPKC